MRSILPGAGPCRRPRGQSSGKSAMAGASDLSHPDGLCIVGRAIATRNRPRGPVDAHLAQPRSARNHQGSRALITGSGDRIRTCDLRVMSPTCCVWRWATTPCIAAEISAGKVTSSEPPVFSSVQAGSRWLSFKTPKLPPRTLLPRARLNKCAGSAQLPLSFRVISFLRQ